MMRKFVVVLAAMALMPACSGRGARLSSPSGANAPQKVSILGDWVLATDPDSTAFTGAQSVELSLQQGAFTITARYAGQAPVVISGIAQIVDTDGGPVRLVPSTVTQAAGGARVGISPGQPIEVVATAADNSMVFAPPTRLMLPSSVWHRRDAARRAGTIDAEAAGAVDPKKRRP